MSIKKNQPNKRSSTLPSPPPKREKKTLTTEESNASSTDSEAESLSSKFSEKETSESNSESSEETFHFSEQVEPEKSELPLETVKNLLEILKKLRLSISPELSQCLDSSVPSESLIEALETLTSVHKNTLEAFKTKPEYQSRLVAIRKKITSVYSLVLQALSNVRPLYQSNSTNLFESIESMVSETDEFSRECAISRMWHPLAQINSRLQRSALVLNQDPTVLGSVAFTKTEQEITSASQKAFRDFYMENLTENYGDDLDKLREEEGFNQARLEMLIDSLESGMTLFPESDRDLLMLSTH